MGRAVNVSDRRTDLRKARVSATEERILGAAHELFVRNGYGGTTLTAVADAAGVGHRTVYVRFRTKAELLNRVIDVALVGDTLPIPVADRPGFQAALGASTLDERIDAWAEAGAALMGRVAAILAVGLEAQHVVPAVAAAAQAGRKATREAVKQFWQQAEADGLLAPGCDVDWIVDTASLLAHAETYLLGVRTMRWGPKRYRTWLAETWRRLATACT